MVKLDFDIVLVGYLLETKKGYKNLKKQEVEHIFIKTNWTKSVFKIVWLKVILTLFRMGHLGMLMDGAPKSVTHIIQSRNLT